MKSDTLLRRLPERLVEFVAANASPTPTDLAASGLVIFTDVLTTPAAVSRQARRTGQLDGFHVIGIPGQALAVTPKTGDILIRIIEGGAGHTSVIAREGLHADPRSGASFVHVVERTPAFRPSAESSGRLITDSAGRLLEDLVLLRLAMPPAPPVVQVSTPSDAVEPTDLAVETSPAETTISADRVELSNTPLLSRHRGTQPDLILRWNSMVDPAAVDVVVHLHGYSSDRERMRLVNKERYSGLDWSNPDDPSDTRHGRTSATLGIVPRGSYGGDAPEANPERYAFPALVTASGLRDLISYSLSRFQTAASISNEISRRRLIITAHSGGGAALMGILAHNDPDEIYVFDALYNDACRLVTWVNNHIAAEIRSWRPGKTRADGALCVIYRAGGTADQSRRVYRAIQSAISAAPADAQPVLSAAYRVVRTSVAHGNIPRRFGWLLLADPAQALASTVGAEAAPEAEAIIEPEVDVSEGLGPEGPTTDTFADAEFMDYEEWVDVINFNERINSVTRAYEETERRDSTILPNIASLKAQGLFRDVAAPGPGQPNYQLRLRGRICYPKGARANEVAGTRAFPVAILLHGNHDWTVANHLGYEYLQEELAKRGIISMSVNTNAANAFDSWLRIRADFVLAGLRELLRLSTTVGHRLNGRIDFSKVGLMGHSRGADAVVKAAILNRGNANFTIKAVCSIAPTDLTGTAREADRIRLLDSDGLRYLVLYGSHDGDVGGQGGPLAGTGFRHYDRATCAKTMIFVKGAKHNRFNTKWDNLQDYSDPDDCSSTDPDFLPDTDHRQLAIDYVGGLFRLELNGELSIKNLFDGSAAPTAGAGGPHTICVQWSPPRLPRKLAEVLFGTPVAAGTRWTTGWTTLMPFSLPGRPEPFELAYKTSTGDVAIDVIDPATGTSTIWSDHWKTGWTHFMPFAWPGDDRPYYMAYMAATGEVAVDRILRDGRGVDSNIWKDKWTTGWTTFMPVRLPNDNRPYALFYKADTGRVSIDRITLGSQGTANVFQDDWTTGWTTFIPFRLPGSSDQHYLAYKKDTGEVAIDRIASDGKSVTTIWRDTWSTGWTIFVPLRVPGDDRPHYLAYKKDDGDIAIDRVWPDGKGVDVLVREKWTKGWTFFMTLHPGGKPHLLIYNSTNGDVAINRLLPEKMLEIEDFEGADTAHDLLGGAAATTAASRLLFTDGVGPTMRAVHHQTMVLKATAAGGKYRAEIPSRHRNFIGFDLLTFRLASDFDLTSKTTIATPGAAPDFKVRIMFGVPGSARIATKELTHTSIDNSGVRDRQRPFFRQISFGGACVNGTKIVLQTLAIPLQRFTGVNWQDVRAIEFETGPHVVKPVYFDSLQIVQS